jgi:hypothetical protein
VLLPNFFKLKYYVGISKVHEKVERRLAKKIDRHARRKVCLQGAWRGQAHYACLVSFHATVPCLRWR